VSKHVVVLVVAIAAAGAWYAFRPEKLFVDESVAEAFPAAESASGDPAAAVELATGFFHGVAHEGRGRATIHGLPDGSRVLRLTDFETSNGPDVRLLLVAAADATDSDSVREAGYLELGRLTGNRGDQNYEVPAGADLAEYRAVTVWCHRFGVNFATAPLSLP
jgi:hypothetical protein